MRYLTIAAAAALSVCALLPTAPVVRAAFPGANGDILFVTDSEGKPTIARMTADGTGIDLLTHAGETGAFGDDRPVMSPGGTKILFVRYRDDGNGDIWEMNSDGTQTRSITPHAADDDWPDWAPDGSRIVFASNRHGNYEIYSMATNGSDVKRLTTTGADDMDPAWSPDNKTIAFMSNRRGHFEIYTMNADGSGVIRRTTSAGPVHAAPAWSPNGARIAYSSLAGGDSDIWVTTLATGVAVPLRESESLEASPAFAPDPTGSPENGLIYTDDSLGHADIAQISSNGPAPGFAVLTTDWIHDAYRPHWISIPAFPLVDARFSTFKTDIEWVFNEGITVGCSPERYCPNEPVTREQMATFLVRALDLPPTATDYFTDDESSTHEQNINRLAAAGITSGCAPGKFCPTAPVARDQMASFLARALNLPATATDYFTDDEGNTHEANINRLRASGITTGCTPTTYCPSQTVTRGQMAAFLHRAFD